jgi:hypothetical protein
VADVFVIGRPRPRADDAYVERAKWGLWILAPRGRGHGAEWGRVFRVGPDDAGALWTAIADAVRTAPIVDFHDTREGGVSCRVDVRLTIRERSALVRTAWHYAYVTASPRLVTAFPTL